LLWFIWFRKDKNNLSIIQILNYFCENNEANMSNSIIAVSPKGLEYKMSRLTAETHKHLMLQANERGWFYGTREEINAWRNKSGYFTTPSVQEISKDNEILELKRQLAELQAMQIAQEEKELPNDIETPMNAKVVIGFINSAHTIEEVERIAGTDKRSTILKAAKKRISELT
jgi:hypothetical protein